MVRDCMGRFVLGCYSINIGHCNVIHAEFMALWKGLQVAWDNGFRKYEVCMDNIACVQTLNYQNNYKDQANKLSNIARIL